MNDQENRKIINQGILVSNAWCSNLEDVMRKLRTQSTDDNEDSLIVVPRGPELGLVKVPTPEPPKPVPAEAAKPAPKRGKRKRNSIDAQNFKHITKNENLDPPEYICTICNR